MKKIVVCIAIFFTFSSCSYDKILTGVYYIKHDNAVEEYLIMKFDSTFVQFLIYERDSIKDNNGTYSPYPLHGKNGITLNHYVIGYGPLDWEHGMYTPHDSSKEAVDLYTSVDGTIFGMRQIIIDFNRDIYITKISQSYNSDSVLVEIKKNLNH